MLKAGGESMIMWLTDIINHVWVRDSLPDDWRRDIILPFWKQKGDQYVCKKHRSITLLSIKQAFRADPSLVRFACHQKSPKDSTDRNHSRIW